VQAIKKHWVSALIGLFVLVFLYLPIVHVIVNAFNANRHMRIWGGFTLKWFQKTLASADFYDAFRQSLTIALCVTLLSVIVAVTAVIGIRSFSSKVRNAESTYMYIRLTLPEVILVVGIMIVISMIPGASLGPVWVVLVQSLIYSAYDMVIIQARLSTIADRYENAAYDLGATTWRVLKTVIFPLLAPSIFVGALLAFTFSLDAVVSVVFLGGPTTETLPIMIMSMIKRHVTPEVNAIGVIVMIFNMVILGITASVIGVRNTVSAVAGEAK
jgi:ABC-type spermidine/putrescine transport system permease subunit II